MPSEIRCPSCGNRGAIDTHNSAAFETRGRYEGKAVARCRKCGSGLFIGAFSGVFMGSPKIVPAVLWQRMDEMWKREFAHTTADDAGLATSDKEVNASAVLSGLLLPSREWVDYAWKARIAPIGLPASCEGAVKTELFYLTLFAVDMSISQTFEDDAEAHALLDALYSVGVELGLSIDEMVSRRTASIEAVRSRGQMDEPTSLGAMLCRRAEVQSDELQDVAGKLWLNVYTTSRAHLRSVHATYRVVRDQSL